MYKAIIAIGIAAAICSIAGCGSSSDETAEAATTKPEFITEADAICNKTRSEVQDAAAAWEQANGKELDIETAFRQILGPALQQQAEELRSLPVPKADQAELTRMFGNLSKGASAFVAEGSAAKFEAFKREAEAYGLGACGI